MPRILLLGDAHGDLQAIRDALHWAKDHHDCVAAIQVGDFGWYPWLDERLAELGRLPIPLHAIDGNHEDHAWLDQQRKGRQLRAWAKDHDLHYHPRGSVSTLAGLRIAWCGGAAHADRPQEFRRRPRTSPAPRGPDPDPIWSTWVSAADATRTMQALAGKPVDVIVTHSCPAGIGIGMRGMDMLAAIAERHIEGFGLHGGPGNDLGEQHLASLWQALPTKPRHWWFGHWHTIHNSRVDGCQFICCGAIDRRSGLNHLRFIHDTHTGETTLHQAQPAGSP